MKRVSTEITQLHSDVKDAFKQAKEEKFACPLKSLCYRPNGKREEAVKLLAEKYLGSIDANSVGRLANILMHEELTNSNPDKMTSEEYPIMSDYQLARRQHGKHRKKAKANDLPTRMEVPLSWAENYGHDGKNYSYPTRRQRDDYENEWIDEESLSKNEEIREKYNAFVKGKLIRDGRRVRRVFSKGLFTVDIETGNKTIHSQEDV